MTKMSPQRRLVGNILSNWACIIIAAIIGFFMSPFLVHNLGKEVYGVFALVISMIAYTEFFDIGMRQSLARYLPKYYALKDYRSLNEISNSSNVIYIAIACATALGTFIVAFFFMGIFNVSPDLAEAMRITFIILGLNQAFDFLVMTWGALGPFHRYDLLNGTNIGKALVSMLLTFYFVKRGYGLVTLATITLSVNIAASVVRIYLQRRIVPQLEFSFRYVKRERIKELMGYGIMSLLIVVSTIAVFFSDNIIIGIFLSTSDVTFFSIAGNLIHQLRMFVSSVGVPLVPAISHLDASSDSDQILALYRKVSNYLYYIVTCICVGVFVFGRKFIYLWMGPDFSQTVTILFILIVPGCFYFPQVMANSVLLGIGKLRQLLYILASEAVSKIVLSIILVNVWGINGVAIATAIPQTIIYVFIYPYVFHRIMKGNLRNFYQDCFQMIVQGVIFTLPAGLLAAAIIKVNGWTGLFLEIGMTGIFILGGFYWRIMASDDKKRIMAIFKK